MEEPPVIAMHINVFLIILSRTLHTFRKCAFMSLTAIDHVDSYLFVGEDFVVGRKDASLLISKDPSVSRRHAVLRVEHPEENLSNPSKKSSLFLRDEGSKYGTFKNGTRVSGEVQLAENDVVKFGQFDSEYKVCLIPLVVTTSCLAVLAKRDLRKAIHGLGGHLISEWQPSCSHLAMTDVRVTIKALCCLLSAKPIVKPQYFQDLKKGLKTSTFVPPKQYIPPIGEALIDKDKVSFDINLQRKTLFQNKTFFFLDEKQCKKLLLGITLGGGNATILTSENMDPEILLQEGCCVIDPLKESQSSLEVQDIMPAVMAILGKKKLRLIPESDIGLSVAYCSTEIFCNPQYNTGEVNRSLKIVSQTLTQREVYVPDTEEKAPRREQKPKNVMPADACSSLHLSSFQIGTPAAEDMDVSEIPLSAQMKRELDDIFAEPEPVQSKSNIPANTDVLLPSSPVRMSKRQKRSVIQKNESSISEEPEPVQIKSDVPADAEVLLPTSPVRTSNRQKRSIVQKMESSPEHHSLEVHSNVPKVEEFQNIRQLSPEPRPTEVTPLPTKTNGFTHLEDDLPRNLMKIEFVSLIVKKTVPSVQKYKNSSVKNFKKFKKVLPKKTQVLPRIIGAHELIAYDRAAAEILNEVWDDPVEEATLPTKGEFDW